MNELIIDGAEAVTYETALIPVESMHAIEVAASTPQITLHGRTLQRMLDSSDEWMDMASGEFFVIKSME